MLTALAMYGANGQPPNRQASSPRKNRSEDALLAAKRNTELLRARQDVTNIFRIQVTEKAAKLAMSSAE